MTGADPINRLLAELHAEHRADGQCPDWCPYVAGDEGDEPD